MDYQLWAWDQGEEQGDYELQPTASTQQLLHSRNDDSAWMSQRNPVVEFGDSQGTFYHHPFDDDDDKTSITPQVGELSADNADTSLENEVRHNLPIPISRFSGGGASKTIRDSRRQKLSRSLTTCTTIGLKCSASLGTFLLLVAACGAVTCTIIYSNPIPATGHILATSASQSVLILRILSEGCTILIWVLVTWAIEDLQWAFASRRSGIGALSFLALDSGTRIWGMLRLLFMESSLGRAHKTFGLIRIILLFLIPVPGITIMSGLSVKPFFSTQYSYRVAAGLADFNASTAQSLSSSGGMTYLFDISYPLWDRRVSFPMTPLGPEYGRCHTQNEPPRWSPCEESILLTGGCLMISPQNDDFTIKPHASTYVVETTKGYQVEFGPVYDQSVIRTRGICKTQGYDIGALHWCIALGDSQEIIHAYNICPLQIMSQKLCFKNTSWVDQPFKFSSAFYVYRRTFTVSYSRNNLSILAVTDLSPPLTYVLAAEDIAFVFNIIMRTIKFRESGTNATNDDRSSDLALFMSGGLQQSDNPVVQKTALQESRKALAMLLHYFHANGIGAGEPQSIWETKAPREDLPSDMYTTLQFAVPSYHVSASRLSLSLFIGTAGSILFFCFTIGVFTCGTVSSWPWRTGYPSLDFAVYALPTRVRHQRRLCRTIAEMREEKVSGLGLTKKLRDGRFVAE